MRIASLIALLVLLAGCSAARIQHPEALPAFEGFTDTADGWRLSVFRVPPSGGVGQPHHGAPVLLVHGAATNRQTFMLEGSDIASFLAKEGFDVWIAELRGDRTSRPPDERTWNRGDWNVDRMVDQDVPAILDHIEAATGQSSVFWVGHSLGGVLGLVTLQTERASRIRGLIAVGSPLVFSHPTDIAGRTAGLRPLAPKNGQMGVRALASLSKGSLRLAPDAPLFHLVFNADNLDVDAATNFATVGMENIGGGVVEQFEQWVQGGHVTSADGSIDWTEGLSKVTAPVLFVAGRADGLAPPWSVRAGYDRVSSADSTWLTMGRGWGQRNDYGHGDLLIGDWAYEEVFPPIKDWLVSRAARPASEAPSGSP